MVRKSDDLGNRSKANPLRLGSNRLFLVVALLLAGCTPINSQNKTTTIITVSPDSTYLEEEPSGEVDKGIETDVPTPAATLLPTRTESSVEDTPVALVTGKSREIGGYDESVTIEVKSVKTFANLPDLALYSATPLVPDAPGDRCAVSGKTVWCQVEALENIVKVHDLGANPDQLIHEEWLALIAFFTYTMPLDGPDALELIDSYIPASELAKINPPQINLLEPGGIEVSFYYEFVSYDAYPDGPMGLKRLDFTAAGNNEVTLLQRDVWLRPEEDD